MKNLVNVILWCAVVAMWIVTVAVDVVCDIPRWLILIHSTFGVVCLVAAIISIVKYRKRK